MRDNAICGSLPGTTTRIPPALGSRLCWGRPDPDYCCEASCCAVRSTASGRSAEFVSERWLGASVRAADVCFLCSADIAAYGWTYCWYFPSRELPHPGASRRGSSLPPMFAMPAGFHDRRRRRRHVWTRAARRG